MSLISKAPRLFRPFGRACPSGIPETLLNPPISLTQKLSDENGISHSMQVACFRWSSQTLGKRCHTGQVTFCSWLRKAGSVVLAVCRRPVEPPYIRDLRATKILRSSVSPGGRHGED